MIFRPIYFTRRALEGMARAPYVTMVGTATIFVALFATGLMAGVLGGAERLLAAWAGEVRISAYLAPGADLAAAQAAVAAAAPGREVRAVPAAAALHQLSQELGDDAHVLDGVGSGVVPDAVDVSAPGITLAEARALAARLGALPGVAEVDYGNAWLEKLEAVVSRARLAAVALFAALALATAVLVGNTLRLAVFARREEIEIMKLVGATDGFVGTPFLIEGLLQGVAGAGLAILALVGLHALVMTRLAGAVRAAAALRLSDTLPGALLLGLLAGGAAVGLLGSALAVVRSLREELTVAPGLAAALLLLSLAASGPRDRLDTLQARRRAEENAARLLAEQERSVLDTLAEAEQALAEALSEARKAEAARAASEAVLARARREEAAAQQAERERLAALRPRLEARVRMGRTGELQLLLASGSLSDLVKRRYLVDRILRSDVRLLGEAQAARQAQEAARAARQREAVRLAALAEEALDRREDAEARHEEREALLEALRSARGLHERAAAEAGEQERKLADFVATLPPPRTPLGGATGFGALRGTLPHPAPGPITVGFGRLINPRFNTVTVQNGLDIGAPPGAPVRAIAAGRVVHAGWFKGYGNLIIVDHGDGYHSLVAHLGAMRTAMGEEVAAQEVLGTVGDTGSLKGPYLYFELREHGRPVDPRPWLRE